MVKITASEWWHCPFITPNSLIAYHLMTNSLWVKMPIFSARHPHYISWPTASEWQYQFSARRSYHIWSHGQQQVSDNAILLPCGRLITSHPITNRMWVTLPFFLWSLLIPNSEWVTVPLFLHLTLHLMTNSLWVALPFISSKQSHYILSNDQ